jgi:hypothetical protein
MIATDDGGLLLCNYSEQQGVVVVYGENGNYIKTVKLKKLPFDITFTVFRLLTDFVRLYTYEF